MSPGRQVLVLALCLSLVATKEFDPLAGNKTAHAEVASEAKPSIESSLASTIGQKRAAALVQAVGPKHLEQLNKLKKEELVANEIAAAIAKRGQFVRKQALGMIQGLRELQKEAATSGAMLDQEVRADAQMRSKDAQEACLEHPLGCLTLGINGVIATAKAKRGERRTDANSTDLQEESSTDGESEQKIRDLKKAIRTVRKHWGEAERLTAFYSSEAAGKSAAVQSTLNRLAPYVSKETIKNYMQDRIHKGMKQILEEAAAENWPAFKQEDKQNEFKDSVTQWGQLNGGSVADDKAKADLQSLMTVISDQQERALQAGHVQVPNVLATMANPEFWEKLKADSNELATKFGKRHKQALEAVTAHLDKADSDSKHDPNEVSSLDDAESQNALHIARTRQELYESKVRDELDNSVAKRIDLFARPTEDDS